MNVPATVYQLARFVISGLIATGTNLFALFMLVEFFHVWYVLASICAFLFGFFASFTLQKYWTFADRNSDRIGRQAAVYFSIVLINLGLNTLLVYAFVEYIHVGPLIAQTAAAFMIAIEGYFAYRHLVFYDATND